MNKYLKQALLTVLLVFLAQLVSSQDLNGIWKSHKYGVTYEFKADSSIIFEQGGYPIFIKSYTLDSSKSPVWIDFHLKQGDQELIIPGLLKVMSDDLIMIEQFPPYEEHPKEFSVREEGGMISQHVLMRQ